jgi:hypothetical protein
LCGQELTRFITRGALVCVVAGCSARTATVEVPAGRLSVTARVEAHSFPRLANQIQLCCRDKNTEALLAELAFWDLAIIDPAVIVTMPEYLGSSGIIRSRDPTTVLLAYFSGADVNLDANAPVWKEFNASVDSTWYMRDISGNRVPLFEVHPGRWTWALNLTTAASEHIPVFINHNILSTRLVDGIFYDWAATSMAWLNRRSPQVSGPIDMNGDGVAEPDSTVDRLWTLGYRYLLANSQRRFPAATLLVGNAGWGAGWHYDSVLHGVMLERFLDGAAAGDEERGWESVMRTYAHYQTHAVQPRLSILMANRDDPNDTGFMRFALASTLMFDGYFSFTNRTLPTPAYQSARWYDEFAVDLVSGTASKDLASKGYLGSPTSEAFNPLDPDEKLLRLLESGVTGAGNIVWRRDFENGIVLVNPSDLEREIDLGGVFRKIRGVRDPRFNDGNTLSAVSLAPRSGVVLLR